MNPTALSSLFIPSPTVAAFALGPLTIRISALCILAGIVIAVWLTGRWLTARGGCPGVIVDTAMWVVPFGIAGGRLSHVITDAWLYPLSGNQPVKALRIWDGGFGI